MTKQNFINSIAKKKRELYELVIESVLEGGGRNGRVPAIRAMEILNEVVFICNEQSTYIQKIVIKDIKSSIPDNVYEFNP